VPSSEDEFKKEEVKVLLQRLVHASGAKIVNLVEAEKLPISTVHIFGSLPINSNIFILGTARLKADHRIQVSDGSLLPFAPGVNPQAIIMAVCDALVTGE
jgi:hypothetical protein